MIFTKLNFRNSHQISNWYLHKQKSFSTKVPPQNHQNWILRYQEDYLHSQTNIFRVLCHFFQSILVQLAMVLLKNDVLAALAAQHCQSSQTWNLWEEKNLPSMGSKENSLEIFSALYIAETQMNFDALFIFFFSGEILWKKWHRTRKILLWLHR